MLDKKQIEYLIALSNYKSVSKASEALYISQPSLSRYLKSLEDDLGFKIFDRSTTPLSLTKRGKIYLEYLDKFVELESKMYEEIHQVNEKKNEIRISGLSFLSSYIYPHFIPEFINNNPDISLIISDYREVDYEHLILNNHVDIFITNSYPKHKSIKFKTIKKDYIYLACKLDDVTHTSNFTSDKDYNSLEYINFEDLRHMTFYLIDPKENVGKASKQILKSNNIIPDNVIYLPNIVSSTSMLNRKNSATFITKSSLSYINLKDDISLFKIKNTDDLLSIGFIYHENYSEDLVDLVYSSMYNSIT